MSSGQKHHYTAQFYLKGWCGHDNKLCEYSMPHKIVRAKRVYAAETGFEKNLYSLSTETMNFAKLETHYFQKGDSLAAEALECMKSDTDLSEELRIAWARFILVQLHRSPEEIAKFIKYTEKEMPKHQLDEESKSRDNKLIAESSDYNKYADLAKLMIPKLSDNPRIRNFIALMDWHIITLNQTQQMLMTSDRPVIMSNGVDKPDGHIAIAISPNQIFLLVKRKNFYVRCNLYHKMNS